MSSLSNLNNNVWAKSPNAQRRQAQFLTNIIFGHLLKTTKSFFPAHLPREGKHCISTVQKFMQRTAVRSPEIAPSTFIRALFLVFRFDEVCPREMPSVKDAMHLYMGAFYRVGSSTDPSFTLSKFKRLHSVKTGTIERYHDVLVDAIGKYETGASPDELPRLQAFLHFYLAPYLPEPSDDADSVIDDDEHDDEFETFGETEPDGFSDHSVPFEFYQNEFYNDLLVFSTSSSFSMKSIAETVVEGSRHYWHKSMANAKIGARYIRHRLSSPIPRSQW